MAGGIGMEMGGVGRGESINLMRKASISKRRKKYTEKMKAKQIFIIEIF